VNVSVGIDSHQEVLTSDRHSGEFVQLHDATVLPAPDPNIPIVAGGRGPAAARRAGRLGDGLLGVNEIVPSGSSEGHTF
jgi:alkanesulfonate monooxygenase SsuD/methylene tetrahydromethanopterin reductase-like flavin-dependent oxidoreductase (luciferase family)